MAEQPLVIPVTCEGGVRKDCAARSNWRVRERGDTLARNWVGACHRHLSTVCAVYGERAEIDVVRVGC